MSTLKSARFIFMTIRSHYQRFMVMPIVFVALLATFATQAPPVFVAAFAIVVFFVFSSTLSLYPFYASNKTPQLFSALPQRRVDFVRGVYLLYVVLTTVDLLLGFVCIAVLHVAGVATSGLDFMIGIIVVVFSAIMSVELPMLFRLGYAKVQMISNLTLVSIAALPTILIKALHQQSMSAWLTISREPLDNPLVFLGCLAGAAIFLAISYRASLLVYERKDL